MTMMMMMMAWYSLLVKGQPCTHLLFSALVSTRRQIVTISDKREVISRRAVAGAIRRHGNEARLSLQHTAQNWFIYITRMRRETDVGNLQTRKKTRHQPNSYPSSTNTGQRLNILSLDNQPEICNKTSNKNVA